MPKFDSEKTHSELIAERDYWKHEAATLAEEYKQLVLMAHRHQDEMSDVLDSLGTR